MVNLSEKLKLYQSALTAFTQRISEDRWILAVILIGSINEHTILKKEHLYLWLIEADGVTLRKKSDGDEPRIWRTMVEHDVNIWAEVIPRSRFKRIVEGASRTAFSYNFYAKRELIYSTDESISKWFKEANTIALKDQRYDLLISTTWVVHELREALKLLDIKKDIARAWQMSIGAAHALANVHVVQAGEICETPAIYRALELNPNLFAKIYSQLVSAGASESQVRIALEAIGEWLDEYGIVHMSPLSSYLESQSRVVGLSELSNHFAYTQLYPWHIESACEWLVKKGVLQKLAAEMPLTKKSRIHLEEPAYLYHGK